MSVPELARAIYNGPNHIRVQDDRGQIVHGWLTFTLEVSGSNGRPIESRSVYIEPFDDDQNPVVLRAVIWNREAVRNAILKRRTKPLTMPARFVLIPSKRYRAWLAKFEGITLELSVDPSRRATDFVRRVRIGRKYTTNVFEKAWAVPDSQYQMLNKAWEYVWSQMTSALGRPSPVHYAEHYSLMHLKFRYDFEGVQSYGNQPHQELNDP